jgi:hypothetical protein
MTRVYAPNQRSPNFFESVAKDEDEDDWENSHEESKEDTGSNSDHTKNG